MPDTITVASRLPMAIRMAVEDHPPVVINGSNHREALDGAGLTEGVDAEAFDAWMKLHEKSDAVRDKLIQKVEPAKVDEAKKAMPQPAATPVAAAPAALPAPTERADVADLKAMKDSKIAPSTPAAAPPA